MTHMTLLYRLHTRLAAQWLLRIALFLFVTAGARGTEVIPFDLRQEGAATLIVQDLTKGRKAYILVDTGNRSNDEARGGARVRKLLEEKGVKRLDLLILTHMDADHAAGYVNLMGLQPVRPPGFGKPRTQLTRGPPIRVRHVILPEFKTDKDFHRALLKRMGRLGKDVIVHPGSDAAGRILKRLGLQIFTRSEPRNTNDSTLVVVVRDTTGGDHVLTGDMTRAAWKEFGDRLPKKAVTFEGPHHGGLGAAPWALRATQAERYVFHACADNVYQHPFLPLLAELSDRGRSLDPFTLVDTESPKPWVADDPQDAWSRRLVREWATDLARVAEQRPPLSSEELVRQAHRLTEGGMATELLMYESEFRGRIAQREIRVFRQAVVITGDPIRANSWHERFLDELVWNELGYLRLSTLKELEERGIRGWWEAREYLLLRLKRRAANVPALFTPRPSHSPFWLADIFCIVDHLAGLRVRGTPKWARALRREGLAIASNESPSVNDLGRLANQQLDSHNILQAKRLVEAMTGSPINADTSVAVRKARVDAMSSHLAGGLREGQLAEVLQARLAGLLKGRRTAAQTSIQHDLIPLSRDAVRRVVRTQLEEATRAFEHEMKQQKVQEAQAHAQRLRRDIRRRVADAARRNERAPRR